MSLLGIGLSLAGSLFANSSAKKATQAQVEASNRQIEFQEETRDRIIERVDPFYQSGITGQNVLNHLLGLGPAPTIGGVPASITTIPGSQTTERVYRDNGDRRGYYENVVTGSSPERYSVNGQTFDTREQAEAYANANPTGGTEYAGFQATPGYQFAMDEALAGVNALAGAQGGLDSGATRQALQERSMGLANQEFNNYLNRITGVANTGLNAAALQGTADTNAATGVSNALANIGNAQSAGYAAQGNIWSNTLNDVAGLWQYQRGQGAFPNAPAWL